jgi:hypothetical protein
VTWKTIDSAPRDGTRVRVGHEDDPSSMRDGMFKTTGAWVEDRWQLSAFFVVADGRLMARNPTHWQPPTPGE